MANRVLVCRPHHLRWKSRLWKACQKMWAKREHSKNHSHIRARLPGQNSRQHLAEVPIVHSEAVEQPRPNGGKPAQGSKRQLQIRTLLRYGNSQQHLAEGATLRREVEKLRRPNRNQCSAKLYERLQIRVQLHGQEPKQQLADVPERRRDGNEVDQPNSIRTRQVSERRCTSERSCTDKNQNSNWRMCQRAVGMATNSVSRKASERGKTAGCEVKMYQKANMRKYRCFWGFTAIQVP